MKPQETRLGYLLVTSPVTNVFIGGLMVVDGRGLPLEFRYTEPVQPTRIQQILYGSALSRYIKTEVILETLLKSLEIKPNLLIVNEDNFLTDIAITDFEMVRILETKSGPLKSGVGSVEKISTLEFLMQLTGESSPIRVQLAGSVSEGSVNGPKSLPDKVKEPEPDFTQSPVYALLLDIGRMTDILEPVKRVEKALTVLCQEAGIKSGTP